MAQAGWFDKPNADFTNHEVPLYQQITNRIKAKILTRLGEGKNTRDRYISSFPLPIRTKAMIRRIPIRS